MCSQDSFRSICISFAHIYLSLSVLEKQKQKARKLNDLVEEANLCNIAGEKLAGYSKNIRPCRFNLCRHTNVSLVLDRGYNAPIYSQST
jgi:hypothetical protein